MSAAAPSSVAALPAKASYLPVDFLIQDTVVMLRSRRMKLIIGFMAYSVIMGGLVLGSPRQEMLDFVAKVFGGGEELRFKAFLYLWVDGGLNKVLAVAGPVLVGGLFAEERAKGTLAILLSKPMTPVAYFLTRVIGATVSLWVVYAFAIAGGTIFFPFVVPGFEIRRFLLLAFNHAFAAVLCVAFTATVSLFFKHRVTAMFASVMLLMVMINFAFFGFYNPAWRVYGYLCPFYYGVALFAHFDDLTIWRVIGPTLILIAFSVAIGAVGVWRASKVEL